MPDQSANPMTPCRPQTKTKGQLKPKRGILKARRENIPMAVTKSVAFADEKDKESVSRRRIDQPKSNRVHEASPCLGQSKRARKDEKSDSWEYSFLDGSFSEPEYLLVKKGRKAAVEELVNLIMVACVIDAFFSRNQYRPSR
eukprot:m.169885 g.169885  ORF g.169885 m.169885 type:complete len:142 (+) comp39018_c0_seq22:2138-2563(+)